LYWEIWERDERRPVSRESSGKKWRGGKKEAGRTWGLTVKERGVDWGWGYRRVLTIRWTRYKLETRKRGTREGDGFVRGRDLKKGFFKGNRYS